MNIKKLYLLVKLPTSLPEPCEFSEGDKHTKEERNPKYMKRATWKRLDIKEKIRIRSVSIGKKVLGLEKNARCVYSILDEREAENNSARMSKLEKKIPYLKTKLLPIRYDLRYD